MKQKSLEKILGLTAAYTVAGTSANAALIASTTIPAGGLTSPSNADVTIWDIDSDGSTDFALIQNPSIPVAYAYLEAYPSARVARTDSIGNTFNKLSYGAKLGTAADGLFFDASPAKHGIVSQFTSSFVYVMSSANAGGWLVGDTGYFGFKFTNSDSGTTHYGWAEMTLSLSSAEFTINEAWYNDTPDGEVTVGVVPEPAEVGFGLGVLALGAAGLRRMRENRKSA